ncbi:MAG: transcription termination factor Rho, partial [Rubricoccaceae bacterium]|nr:transcription termination factor Rho [Rubricoccaceae bacterium]
DESTQDEASRSAKSRDDSSERVDEQEAHDDADVQEDESERSHARRNGRDERSDRSGRGKRRGDRRKKDRRRDADSKHPGEPFDGMLELIGDKKFGFIREFTTSLIKGDNDPFMPPPIIQKHKLRDGVRLKGIIKPGRKGAWQVTQVDEVMGVGTDEWAEFTDFDSGVTIYPEEKLNLVTGPADVSMRVIDLVAPLGKGQRALIVAPPRAGKTVMLKQIAAGISDNHEEVDLVALLVDERPEEVTDFVRNTSATVFASSNDYGEDNHIRVATLAFEYSRRLVEMGRDVVILLDSLTRLGRTFNLWGGNSGRTMSGGLDARALVMPRKIFGAARNIENGGSLTIIATALVETGSRMDEVIFEEFKGTGNSEIVLDRELADKRIYPAINIRKSGTRNEERLISDEQIRQRHMLLRVLADRHPVEAMQALLKQIQRSPTNIHLLNELIPEQTY